MSARTEARQHGRADALFLLARDVVAEARTVLDANARGLLLDTADRLLDEALRALGPDIDQWAHRTPGQGGAPGHSKTD